MPAPHSLHTLLHYILYTTLTLHHTAPHLPAPPSLCTTLTCTTSSLHYTCPAPRCTNALHDTRLHTMAIRPAPQPPCTILNHTRLHHTPELHSPCTTPAAPARTTPYTIRCMICREGISHIVSAACRLQQATTGYSRLHEGGRIREHYIQGAFM